MSVEFPLCRYRIDADDRLVWVDHWWLAFARENGAEELDEASVLGRSVYDFIGGEITRQLYREINRRVRETGLAVVLPFRCDSPSVRRHMQLTISADGSGDLHYDSLLLRAEPRVSLGMIRRDCDTEDYCLEMCSNCKHVYVQDQHRWCDLDRAYVILRLFEAQQPPAIRYSICSACDAVIKQSEAFAG